MDEQKESKFRGKGVFSGGRGGFQEKVASISGLIGLSFATSSRIDYEPQWVKQDRSRCFLT